MAEHLQTSDHHTHMWSLSTIRQLSKDFPSLEQNRPNLFYHDKTPLYKVSSINTWFVSVKLNSICFNFICKELITIDIFTKDLKRTM